MRIVVSQWLGMLCAFSCLPPKCCEALRGRAGSFVTSVWEKSKLKCAPLELARTSGLDGGL